MPEPPPEERPPRRRRFWLLAGGLFPTAFGAAVFLVDRRGARVLVPPPSATGPGGPALPELPPSTVSLEVRLDPDRLRAALEDRIRDRFGDVDERRVHPDDPRISYAVAAEREPLELEVRSDTVRLSATLRYQGRAWFDSPLGREIGASCPGAEADGEGPRAVVRLASPLRIREDWRVASAVTVQDVRSASAGEGDRCRVALGPLGLDVTDGRLVHSTVEGPLTLRIAPGSAAVPRAPGEPLPPCVDADPSPLSRNAASNAR